MGGWSTVRRRTAVVASAAVMSLAGIVIPASAAQVADEPDGDEWGTVVPGPHCAQANSWIARVEGIGKYVNTTLFETHSPPTPTAPEDRGGGDKLVNLTVPPGIGLGVVNALSTRAVTGRLPGTPGSPELVPVPCAAYARAQGASVDVGLPYIANPIQGGTQLSPLGVHVDAIDVDATAKPGQPVAFRGGAASAYLSVFGKRIIDIPKLWPVNFGVRIPADRSQAAFALATTNEQVTTDAKGMPTLDAKGHYMYDPTASSGYINAIHASVLGLNVVDANVGHAAVLQAGAIPK